MAKAKQSIIAIVLIFVAFGAHSVFAAMTSANYQIQLDTIGFGGTENSGSASYTLRDAFTTIGSQGATSSNYLLDSGYGISVYDPVVEFEIFGQSRISQVAATAMTSSSVTVTSVTGYTVGDYIAVVQDEGVAQVAAIGRITSVDGTTLNVDSFSYDTLPTIDGSSGDYVYELTGSTMNLGTLSESFVATSIVGWEASSDVSGGYNVYVVENQDLTGASTAETIGDVGDGAVTAGSDEYGARASDTSLSASTFDTIDTAITGQLQQVASRTARSFATRDFLTLKLATNGSHSADSYTQTITLVLVGDY